MLDQTSKRPHLILILALLMLAARAAIPSPLVAQEIRFRSHAINTDSQFPACAAIDVNGDQQLDIVCGGFWYEAPSWKKHCLREVQQIRGRFDDYAHLPLDVNGDGLLDVATGWEEGGVVRAYINPGPIKSTAEWPAVTVGRVKSAEDAVFFDVDNEGANDGVSCCEGGTKTTFVH